MPKLSTKNRPSNNSRMFRHLTPSQQAKLTPFRATVLEALCEVPAGRVTTYKYLAKYIGCNSSQAIGQALRNNPFAPQVPCHRVIKTDRSLGGFGGMMTGCKIDKKARLLKDEGVKFTSDGRVEEGCIFDFVD